MGGWVGYVFPNEGEVTFETLTGVCPHFATRAALLYKDTSPICSKILEKTRLAILPQQQMGCGWVWLGVVGCGGGEAIVVADLLRFWLGFAKINERKLGENLV